MSENVSCGRLILPDEYPGAFDEDGTFIISEKAKRLIDRHGGRVVPFRNLPEPAQRALIRYMAIDGEAWELPDDIGDYAATADLPRYLGFYQEHYGDKEFGFIAAVPIVELIESAMHDRDIAADPEGFVSWEPYHCWYMNNDPKHSAPEMWPVILSSFWDETLQDGWTRFHQYVERGEAVCPALFYVREREANTDP